MLLGLKLGEEYFCLDETRFADAVRVSQRLLCVLLFAQT